MTSSFVIALLFYIFPCIVTLQHESYSSCKNIKRISINNKNFKTRLLGTVETLNFLSNPDQSYYLTSVLRRSIEASNKCLKDGKKIIEIEFPANRKSDLSVTETLDTNRYFAREFVKGLSSFGKELWLVFPDRKECSLAKKLFGENLPFTLTSIEGLKVAPVDQIPKVIVSVNPGFNVEEWIDLAGLTRGATLIVINGNLDRLRNGYYPALFYPGLTRVTKEFYSQATQALFLSAIAVSGNRYAGWITRVYPDDWAVITAQRGSKDYEVLQTTLVAPDATKAWNLVKKSFADKGFGWF